ncbi:MAG: 4Fe-4S dicluster domain-containing protein [Terriglobia bacterium]
MPQWGMVIDIDRCTGCSACVVACRAENNLPVVGEEESNKGRAFNWIRIERYYEGEFPNVRTRFMPVLCQHCQEAPCEPVCPVYATYHTPEGLNAQIYNRCIGTRFCANACPYTVRYFNWFDPVWEPPLERQLNPDVSLRSKGVMEKCSFCVQRIRRARDVAQDAASAEGKPTGEYQIPDGAIQPACVQSCPSEALVFGDLEDTESRVARLKESRRAFHLLEELGTQPHVIYLKPED